ncbi:MAG: hypothetical protein KDH20_09665 [Rhodocyclaceae bacterium]|nr:hypothetical protein [Rhodocyclaceae bacterium]
MDTGILFNGQLAEMFGLPAEQAVATEAPLLGAAVQLKRGVRGRHVCVLHAFIDAAAPVRLGEAEALSNIQSRNEVAPYAFVLKPSRALRGAVSQRNMVLANRALLRMSQAPLAGATTVDDDRAGAYSSLPLDGYERGFLPGVTWLAMSFNCAAVAAKAYTDYTLFLERDDAPEGQIANLQVDPARLVSLAIPARLFDAMRAPIERAMSLDDAPPPGQPPLPFTIVSGQ